MKAFDRAEHLLSWPWEKYDKYRCPDGSIKRVAKDINHAFPLKFSTAKANFESSLDILKKVKGKVKGSLEERLDAILVNIDTMNASMQFHYRGAYSAYANDPCSGFDHFSAREMEISKQDMALRRAAEAARSMVLLMKSNSSIADATMAISIDRHVSIIEDALGRGPDTLIIEQMATVERKTQEWRGDNEGN